MTPFAQMEKKAWGNQPQGQYGNPYARAMYGSMPRQYNGPQDFRPGLEPPTATSVAPPKKGGWGWGDTGELATDVALGWNPISGVPWFGGKAIKNFSDGNWGQGLMNIGFGALSFLPGGGSAGAAIKGGVKASTKLLPRMLAAPGKLIPNSLRPLQHAVPLSAGARKGLGVAGWSAAGTGIGTQVFGGGGAGEARPPLPQFAQQPPSGRELTRDFVDTIASQWRDAEGR